ncbi:MAG: hypothetical protein AB9842_13095 [Bacteroidales bacterium]
MINLNFTEKELETLKEYFQSELFKAEQKIDSIRGILGKIGKKYSKTQKAEKKSGKRGRKKVNTMASLLPVSDIERKKPGRKPKLFKEANTFTGSKTQKKRGRPPKIKTEPLLAAVKAGKIKGIKDVPKVKKANLMAEKTKKTTISVKPAATSEIVKRKPGRPRIKPEIIAAEKKTKVLSKSKNLTPKLTIKKKSQAKVKNMNAKKKEPKTPKIPWGDWILTVLRDSDVNLTREQIFKAVTERLKLSGEELKSAELKLKDHLVKLLKVKKILPDSDRENPAFGLKIVGKGIK